MTGPAPTSVEGPGHQIHLSLAALPGLSPREAVLQAIEPTSRESPLSEPRWGCLSTAHVQLVPQTRGMIDDGFCDWLLDVYPETQFRLHANVRVLHAPKWVDISGFAQNMEWLERAALISRKLKAPAYSAHSGRRDQANFATMLDLARMASDLFEAPVAIEGQYPVEGDALLVSTWCEYQQLLESKAPFALDLSHLNILACKTGRRETSLVKEMLSSPACLEVHVSSNDGRGDTHEVCAAKDDPWWMELLGFIQPAAVIFSEGNQRLSKTPMTANAAKATTARSSRPIFRR